MVLCSCVVLLNKKIYKILTVQIRNRRSDKGRKQTVGHFHLHDEKLRCPYKGCEKKFDKPTVLDTSTIPRQSYYACPYCMSKLDIITEGTKVVDVRATEYPTVFDSPAKCAHFSGLMNSLPPDAPLPDECLVCPKVLQCNLRKK
jgi:DNA-directed RNA polymerase subunit RPC12/RpoP